MDASETQGATMKRKAQIGGMIVSQREDGAWRYHYIDNRGRDRTRRLSDRERERLEAALAAKAGESA